jgi:hypothetical protein
MLKTGMSWHKEHITTYLAEENKGMVEITTMATLYDLWIIFISSSTREL